MKKLAVLLTFLAVAAAHGQTTNTPSTWFGVYNSTVGATLVRGMSPIGSLTGQVTYPVDLRVERLTIDHSTNSTYAVAVRTRFSKSVSHVDYIDYDELDGLIRGLATMSAANHNSAPMDDFEVVYRLRCGMSVAKISNGNNIVIAIRSADANGTRNQIASYVLDDFQRLLSTAKSKIETIAAGGQ